MDVGLGHRHLVDPPPVDLVAHAHRHRLQPGEHVQLGEEEVGDAVDPRGVAADHGVEPPAAARPAGGDPDLAADLAQPLAHRVEQLGRERAGADAGGVRLEDPDHPGDPGGADARADRGAACRRVRAGHVGVGAVVDVEQRALAALEQDRLAALERLVEQQAGVGDPVGEAAPVLQHRVDDLVDVQRAPVVDLHQDLVLQLERGLDLLVEDLLVEHVRDPDADARDLVLVGRADAAAGGADLGLAEEPLGDLVHGHVVRHDQVRIRADQQARRVDAAGLQPGQLVQQHAGVHDDAVADHVPRAGREDARRDEVQREVLPVGQHDGVPGVVAALIAHHPLHGPPQQVRGLALALVAPLGADEHDRRHVTLQSSASTAPRSAEVPAGKGNGSRGVRRRERGAPDLRGRSVRWRPRPFAVLQQGGRAPTCCSKATCCNPAPHARGRRARPARPRGRRPAAGRPAAPDRRRRHGRRPRRRARPPPAPGPARRRARLRPLRPPVGGGTPLGPAARRRGRGTGPRGRSPPGPAGPRRRGRRPGRPGRDPRHGRVGARRGVLRRGARAARIGAPAGGHAVVGRHPDLPGTRPARPLAPDPAPDPASPDPVPAQPTSSTPHPPRSRSARASGAPCPTVAVDRCRRPPARAAGPPSAAPSRWAACPPRWCTTAWSTRGP